jgi:hypothetical protein
VVIRAGHFDVVRSVVTFAPMSKIGFRCAGSLDRSDRWAYAVLSVDVADALAAFKFIGVDEETWGAWDTREIAPLVRRGLWPSRNASPMIRSVLIGLLDLTERAGDEEGIITYNVEEEIAAQ